MIPHDIRKKCVELANEGKRYSEIYKEYIRILAQCPLSRLAGGCMNGKLR